MKFLKFFKNNVANPKFLCVYLLKKTGKLRSDTSQIKLLYWINFKRIINLDNPLSFNEKLNWLKLYDRNPLYSILVDKYAVKDYVGKVVGYDYVVPCYGVWNSYDDIDFDKLPNQFVLKTTHDSSGATIIKDKNTIDHILLKQYFSKLLKRDYYIGNREWPYKNVTHRIIAEKYLKDNNNGNELRDYKFLCFNGIPKFMYCTNKGVNIRENYYDMDFNPVYISHGFERHYPEFDKPEGFELMRRLATKLAKDIPFVRIDFFQINGKVYFGEFTFYDWGGMKPFTSIEWDNKLGSMLKLPI